MPPAGRRVGVLNVEPVFVEAHRVAGCGRGDLRAVERAPAVQRLVGGCARVGFRLDIGLARHRTEALDLCVARRGYG